LKFALGLKFKNIRGCKFGDTLTTANLQGGQTDSEWLVRQVDFVSKIRPLNAHTWWTRQTLQAYNSSTGLPRPVSRDSDNRCHYDSR